jgi:hypothetical protein
MNLPTKEEKEAEKEKAERKLLKKLQASPPWLPRWNSVNGPARRLSEKPYRGKAERRRVIKERRERKKEQNGT